MGEIWSILNRLLDDLQRAELLKYLNESTTAEGEKKQAVLPEVDMYIQLNVLIYLLDKNELEKVTTLAI